MLMFCVLVTHLLLYTATCVIRKVVIALRLGNLFLFVVCRVLLLFCELSPFVYSFIVCIVIMLNCWSFVA